MPTMLLRLRSRGEVQAKIILHGLPIALGRSHPFNYSTHRQLKSCDPSGHARVPTLPMLMWRLFSASDENDIGTLNAETKTGQ